MPGLNLEIRHGNEWGDFRYTHPIGRPEGFSDDEYSLHAKAAADLVARVLTGEPGDSLRVTGVVMMVVEEGSLSEDAIARQLNAAARKFNDNQTWREAHVIKRKLAAPTQAS